MKQNSAGVLGFAVESREIEGKLCIGMKGNLDTLDDALLWFNQHDIDGSEKKKIAEFIVRCMNADFGAIAQVLLANWKPQ